MSDNVLSYGFFAKLKTPLDYESVSGCLDHLRSPLKINYEGTILYTEHFSQELHGIRFHNLQEIDKNLFFDECFRTGFLIDTKSIVPYQSIWYNGADSYMDEFKVEDYPEYKE